MNSRMRFSNAIAPSSLDRVITSPHPGQAKPVRLLGGLAVCVVGGEKKLPSKICPAKHSHRLNDKSSSPVGIVRSQASHQITWGTEWHSTLKTSRGRC